MPFLHFFLFGWRLGWLVVQINYYFFTVFFNYCCRCFGQVFLTFIFNLCVVEFCLYPVFPFGFGFFTVEGGGDFFRGAFFVNIPPSFFARLLIIWS